MKTFSLSLLLVCLMFGFGAKSYGQTAENLNLNNSPATLQLLWPFGRRLSQCGKIGVESWNAVLFIS